MEDYTDTVIDHFENPRNCGSMENPDGISQLGDIGRGDFLKVYIRVDNNIVTDVKYLTRGCPACIACASMMTQLAIGKNLDNAMHIESEDIAAALGGLPKEKLYCANRGAIGLQEAIINHVYGTRKRSK
ncbi:MAG: iron-sulfur cluster assembly scaffold protein [Syntrophorhabdaceae bacterium]